MHAEAAANACSAPGAAPAAAASPGSPKPCRGGAQAGAKPLRHGVAFWAVRADGAVLLRRRPEKGLLGGMMEVPSTDWRAAPWRVEEAMAASAGGGALAAPARRGAPQLHPFPSGARRARRRGAEGRGAQRLMGRGRGTPGPGVAEPDEESDRSRDERCRTDACSIKDCSVARQHDELILRRGAAGSTHLAPHLLAQEVDQDRLAFPLDIPEGPAVAGGRALHLGADLVDRAARVRRRSRVPSARTCAVQRCALVEQHLARLQQPALDQRAEGNARLLAPRFADRRDPSRGGHDRSDALLRQPRRNRGRARCR